MQKAASSTVVTAKMWNNLTTEFPLSFLRNAECRFSWAGIGFWRSNLTECDGMFRHQVSLTLQRKPSLPISGTLVVRKSCPDASAARNAFCEMQRQLLCSVISKNVSEVRKGCRFIELEAMAAELLQEELCQWAEASSSYRISFQNEMMGLPATRNLLQNRWLHHPVGIMNNNKNVQLVIRD